MDKMAALTSLKMLDGLTAEQFSTLEQFTEVVNCTKDENLFKVGQAASQMYFLLDGKISVQVQLSSRPETVSLVVLANPGQLVGWSGLIEEAHYTATGLCMEDSQLLAIDGKQFMTLLEEHPKAGFAIMRRISLVISGRMRNLQSVVLKTM
jgi:toluene monooxygenase system ferredoxin subunit